MSNTILIDGNQPKVANAALGLNTERVDQVNKNMFSSGYEWYEPDEGVLGYIYPEIWHPLYGESKTSEILSQTLSLQNKFQSAGEPPQESMKKAVDKVSYVIKQFPYRRELTGMSRWGIAMIICIIMMLVINYFSGKHNWYYIFAMAAVVTLIAMSYHLFKYLVYSKAESQKLWSTYTSYIDASGYSGNNLNSILAELRKKEEHADLIMAQQQSVRGQPIGFSSGLGAGLGAGIGNSLSSVIGDSISGIFKK